MPAGAMLKNASLRSFITYNAPDFFAASNQIPSTKIPNFRLKLAAAFTDIAPSEFLAVNSVLFKHLSFLPLDRAH
jgi:hypothetical protein